MKTLNIDIETYSSTDLTKSGVYKYVQAPDFDILLFAYAFDDEPVQVVDLASGEELPNDVWYALTNDNIIKTAFNANFEITCIRKHFIFGDALQSNAWQCTMVKASMLGLPLSLDATSRALKLEQSKDSAGKALIRYFSLPCKPTKTNGERTRNLPHHNPEKWQQFKEYCRQDVVVEKAIRDKISFFTIPETEKKLWQLDQKINDNGVLLDPQFVNNAIKLDSVFRESLTKEAIELTGLNNPNSAAQLKEWLTKEMPLDAIDKLRKEDLPVLTDKATGYINEKGITRVLEIRQQMSKTSIKKYQSMQKCICDDNRVRGLLQFYGANRTGRWAGRLIQVQNLTKNDLSDLDIARQVVRSGDLDLLEMIYANVPDTLSQLIRTAFVAPHGKKFVIADFSAIEARVIAWLAGERWRLDVFATHGKIYEASAAQMFKVPLESISYKDKDGKIIKGSNYHLRQSGKTAELALGYQGGPNALEKMEISNKVPEKARIPEEEKPKVVAMWRNANKKIVQLWNTCQVAAISSLEGNPVTIQHGIRFYCEKGCFFIQLPSGRKLSYIRPKLKEGKFGQVLTYEGMDQTTKQWKIQETYGGKLVENIVQAIARDCLADAMLRVDAAGFKIVMHVHDEIVIEVDETNGCIEQVNKIMGAPIQWAKGLLLKADAYECKYYKKD